MSTDRVDSDDRAIRTELEEELAGLARVSSANGAKAFLARTDALDRLEVHILDRLAQRAERGRLPTTLSAVAAEAAALQARLEGENARTLRELRRRIRAGSYARASLRRVLSEHALTDAPNRGRGYDALDHFVGSLVSTSRAAEMREPPEREMVAYQPTPARAILAFLDRATIRPRDVVYDLGSGLGWVVILVSLLSGARASGIEVEPAYCAHARRCARRLGVRGVSFVEGDARTAPISDGTVFFMYTPFRGAMLAAVLERLRAEAEKRPIRVCTYGPCTTAAEVTAARWLRRAGRRVLAPDEVAVFHAGSA